MADGPVMLSFERHWCAKHLEPFRAEWPAGAGIAQVVLFGWVVCQDEITAACGGDLGQLQGVLDEWGALCCLAGDERMARVVEFTLGGGMQLLVYLRARRLDFLLDGRDRADAERALDAAFEPPGANERPIR